MEIEAAVFRQGARAADHRAGRYRQAVGPRGAGAHRRDRGLPQRSSCRRRDRPVPARPADRARARGRRNRRGGRRRCDHGQARRPCCRLPFRVLRQLPAMPVRAIRICAPAGSSPGPTAHRPGCRRRASRSGNSSAFRAMPRRCCCTRTRMSVSSVYCQTAPSNQNPPATGTASRSLAVPVAAPPAEQLPRRIFGIIPNYRSQASLKDSKPLTVGQKFKLAARDSFDPGTFLLAGAFAGGALALNSASYGHGAAGYGRYYGATYGDLVIGNMMTEAVFPSLLHQDPRYFRKGTGSTCSRLRYAVSQIFLTHGDNGEPSSTSRSSAEMRPPWALNVSQP